ncbi:hypothetical protein [Roseateles chitosanitabidus]|uniref:hypothetical protein n=1 Tax=Roseateles chitosanitabidus TaxID=65048 RepID=UPI000ABA763A|nr:hypothetical protein [Roseateles chitosanitabidus]
MSNTQRWHGRNKRRAARVVKVAARPRPDHVTRIEHDAKNDALLHLLRADLATLGGRMEVLRGDMLAAIGRLQGQIDGLRGELNGLKLVVAIMLTTGVLKLFLPVEEIGQSYAQRALNALRASAETPAKPSAPVAPVAPASAPALVGPGATIPPHERHP